MDNSPPLPRSGLGVPEPHQPQSEQPQPQGTPPQQVPPRRPLMQQWLDEISSGEDSIEELWAVPADAELREWVKRLLPLSRLCCEAGELLAGLATDVIRMQVSVLLEQGADINEIDPVTGRTPLHWACHSGCLELVSLLYELGAAQALDRPDTKGSTPLCLAIHSPVTKQAASLIEFLLKEGAQLARLPNRGSELLHSDFLTIKILTYLEAAGINIDASDRFRETPLLRACAGGKLPLADYLLQHGANPNRPGLFQRTILHIGDLNPDAARLLIQHGAQVDLPDQMGMTPLMVAINCENLAFARILVAHGASLYKKSVDGMSVKDHAVQAGPDFQYFVLREMGLVPDTRPASG